MGKVTVIDRNSLKTVIRPALAKALGQLSDELGIAIVPGNASYDADGSHGTFKLELSIVDDSGAVVTRERSDFEKYGNMYGLTPEMLGAEIQLGGHRLAIAGLKMKARKNNVLLNTVDGSDRQMVAPAATVVAAYNLHHGKSGQRKSA